MQGPERSLRILAGTWRILKDLSRDLARTSKILERSSKILQKIDEDLTRSSSGSTKILMKILKDLVKFFTRVCSEIEMFWYVMGVYIINKTLHGRLEKQNFSSHVCLRLTFIYWKGQYSIVFGIAHSTNILLLLIHTHKALWMKREAQGISFW